MDVLGVVAPWLAEALGPLQRAVCIHLQHQAVPVGGPKAGGVSGDDKRSVGGHVEVERLVEGAIAVRLLPLQRARCIELHHDAFWTSARGEGPGSGQHRKLAVCGLRTLVL